MIKYYSRLLIIGVALFCSVALTAGACDTPPARQDRGGVEGAPPDKISDVEYVEVYRNADKLPTIALACVEGIGFAVPSTGYGTGEGGGAGATPLTRVPEFDAVCAQHRKP